MSYQNIDEQNFKQILGQQLGQVEGILRSKIKTALKVLINKFKQRVIDNATGILTERLAPNVCDRTNDIQNGIEAINGFLFEIQDKLNKIASLAEKILGPIQRLLQIVRLVLSIPIPQSVPPGIGIPINVTTKLSDIKVTVKEFVNQATVLATTIRALVGTVKGLALTLDGITKKLSDVLALAKAYCELLAYAEENELDDEFLDEYRRALLELLEALGLELDELDDGTQFDIVGNELLELLQEFEAEAFIPEGIKSRLRRILLQGSFNSLGDGVGQDGELDGSGIGPDGLPLGDGSLGDLLGNNVNSELFEAIDGNTYVLSVEDDPTSPAIAPRRFGAANTLEGVIVLKSPATFTTDPRIILDDIKVRLNTQLTIL